MTSPTSTLALVRRLGAIIGLSEGPHGSAVLEMPLRKFDDYVHMCDELSKLPLERSSRYGAEFRALYLPSLLRTFFNTPIDTFDAISPHLFASIGSLVKVHVPSAAGHRFIREHPEEAVELRIKAMNLILDWSDRINTLPNSDWTLVMESLVLLYHHLSVAEAVGQDDTQAKINPLRISPAMRTKLRTRLKRLESTTSARTPNSPYARALDDIRAVAFPGQYETPRGSAAINQLVGRGRYFYWWACEEKRRDDVDTRPLTPCDVGSRDELRVCARCLSVRYCSERHQKEHWDAHKLFCVAPTW